ncbi:hypothetical protein FACS189481_3710 [Clostridia bacterium]|nr:hypothetical protein FACS189481_3710 [Clostridia bacterium]
MNVLNKLSVSHMRKNKKGTIMALLGIILSVTLITAISALAVSARQMVIDSAVNILGDWHVKYQNITREQAEKIKANSLFTKGEIKPGNVENKVDLEVKFKHIHLEEAFDKEASRIGVEAGISFGDSDRWGEPLLLSNKPLISLESIEGARALYGGMIAFAGILILIVIAWSTSVISNAFYVSAAQRTQQFGILKSVGATSKQIRKLVLGEGAIISVLAIPVGIVCGFLLLAFGVFVANNLLRVVAYNASTNQYVNLKLAEFTVVFSWPMILAVVVISLITIFISALIPAFKVARTPAIDAIRQVKEVKIKPGTLKIPRFTISLFDVEGVLAAKSLKRHKAKYKTTLRALCCGIFMFVVLFGASGIKGAGRMFAENVFKNSLNADLNSSRIEVKLYDNSSTNGVKQNLELQREMERKLMALPCSSKTRFQRKNFRAVVPDKNGVLRTNQDGLATVRIFALDAKQFDKICLDAGLTPQDYKNADTPKGILINPSEPVESGKGAHIALNSYDFNKELNLSLSTKYGAEETKQVTVITQLKEIPKVFEGHIRSGQIDTLNILVPAETLRVLAKDERVQETTLVFYVQDFFDFDVKAREILDDRKGHEASVHYEIRNPSLDAKTGRNIWSLFMFSICVFIVMLALVAVTNLINIISTSMALRKREFAMLQSVGMTPQGMNRMLNFEGIFLGFKALMIGVPVGIGIFYWTTRNLDSKFFEISWLHVLGGAGICAVAVMLIIFGTMYYSKRLLKKQNIIESINNYNT